jgi:predicted ATP-dependent endonuclease of OLD family
MRIDGIYIKNFRSFDSNGCSISNFGRVNVFIGKNDSGKSNILRFISRLYPTTTKDPAFQAVDYFNLDTTQTIEFKIEFRKGSNYEIFLQPKIDRFTKELNKEESFWLRYIPRSNNNAAYSHERDTLKWFRAFANNLSTSQIKEVLESLGVNVSKLHQQHYHNALFEELISNRFKIENKIYHISDYRKIEAKDGQQENSYEYYQNLFNGANLVRELNKLKNPESLKQRDRDKFLKIQNFIREILNKPDLTIEIDSNERELSLHSNGMQYPLQNHGTGIHQLVILSIAITLFENHIFCIEEPEIFLHPYIQKKFIKFLLSTNNQFFITTHSNSFINIDGVDIFHVQHDGTKSSVNKSIDSHLKNYLLDDLGYHASDILQSNYLLWVEGPSDRIYLNHWIKGKDSKLVEGIHYSIMFYGGSLRSHLSVDEENTIEEFIRINKINRNVGIIQDSDKKNKADDINDTKKRIIKEFEKMSYYNWLTTGKEIENYISSTILEGALKSYSKNDKIKINKGQFDRFNEYKVDSSLEEIDKISLAKLVTQYPPEYAVLDLDKKINDLVSIIKQANGKR